MQAVIAAMLCGSLIAGASKTFIFENDNHTLNTNFTKEYPANPEVAIKNKDPAINDITFGAAAGISKLPQAQKKIDFKILERNKSSESVFPSASFSFAAIPFDDRKRNVFDKLFRKSSALDFIMQSNKNINEYAFDVANKTNLDNNTKSFSGFSPLSPFDFSNFSKIVCENSTCRDYKIENKPLNDEYFVVMKNLFGGKDKIAQDVNKVVNVHFTRRPKAYLPLDTTNSDELEFRIMRNQLRNEIDRLGAEIKGRALFEDNPSNVQRNLTKTVSHVDLTRAHFMPMPVSCPGFRMFGMCNQPHVLSLPPVVIKIPVMAEISIQGTNLSFGDKLGIKMKKLLSDDTISTEY